MYWHFFFCYIRCNRVIHRTLDTMWEKMKSKTSATQYDAKFWSTYLTHLTSLHKCFKKIRDNFQYDEKNKDFCLLIRGGAELKFAGEPKENIITNEALHF